ncbi:MAG: hypothetical protein R3185_05300, partial [Candidatus Thermoplasmatota archaeon]|nr:hypothetical protein [Candidatus Thermoplasmatota archaeon]
MSENGYRLPTTASPRHYHIELRAEPDQVEFEGKVTVHLEVHEPTQELTLHANKLSVDEAIVDWEGLQGAGLAAKHTLDEQAEQLTLTLPREIPAGEATLEITYRAPVRRDMAGLYLSADGDERCLVT